MEPGTYEAGPSNAKLTVLTGRAGAAAKAGHDLVIEVGSWSARLEIGKPSTLELEADSRSLRVLDGTGGLQALTDEDKAEIPQTIDDEVLRGKAISFRSNSVEAAGRGLRVAGELTLVGQTHPVSFELAAGDDGRLSGKATVAQSDWGIKPYSALFGALKVADEVEVTVDTEPLAGA